MTYPSQKFAWNVIHLPMIQIQTCPRSPPNHLSQTSYGAVAFFIYIIGSIFQAAALKFGAQSVVAPLGSLTLVANTVLATKFLNEPFNLNDILGTLFIVIGSTLSVIFGPREDCINPSISELKQNYLQTEFLIFLISLTAITLIDFIGTKYLEYINFASEIHVDYSVNQSKGFSDKEQQVVRTKPVTIQISKCKQLFLMISYVFIAAYFGSINVLLMKSTVIILYTINREYLTEWFFWTIIVSVIIVNLCLEYFRQRALKYFAALFVIPIYQVLLVIGSILMGAMYFNEFEAISAYYFALFMVAIGIILVGIGLMAFNFGNNNTKLNKAALSARMLSP
eukprot:56471_1